jgi:hypothetical protein
MREVKPLPSPEDLRARLRYDPDTGRLYWRKNFRRVREGDRAGYDTGSGYRAIKVAQKQIMEHRVAWAIFYGEWPMREIDHINQNKSDNRIANLRDVDRTENNLNNRNVRGYRMNKGKWEAYYSERGVRHHLGRFSTEAEARAARAKAMAAR